MQKIAVLIAVEPAPLRRIIEHLLSHSEFEIVKNSADWPALSREAFSLHPELIITNLKLLGHGAARIISDIKRASPDSKIIVISFADDLGRYIRKWGADAYLEEGQLVRQLVSTSRELCHLVRPRPGKIRGTASRLKTRRTSAVRSSASSGKHSRFRIHRRTSSETNEHPLLGNRPVSTQCQSAF